MAHWLPPADEGRIPGYSGYVPGMKNHLVGKRYAEASRRAADATDVLREGRNPGGMTTVSMQKVVHGAPSCSEEVHDGCWNKSGFNTVQCCWMTVLLLKHCSALSSSRKYNVTPASHIRGRLMRESSRAQRIQTCLTALQAC